jgi:hypothetical protein
MAQFSFIQPEKLKETPADQPRLALSPGAGKLSGGSPNRKFKSPLVVKTFNRPGSIALTIASGTREPRGNLTSPTLK